MADLLWEGLVTCSQTIPAVVESLTHQVSGVPFLQVLPLVGREVLDLELGLGASSLHKGACRLASDGEFPNPHSPS